MKTIKLTIIGLMLTAFSYGQDTLQQMVSGDNYLTFDNQVLTILSQTNEIDVGNYKDIKIKIDTNQVLQLGLYDDCRKCLNRDIKYRVVIFLKLNNNEYYRKIKSDNNFILVDGSKIKQITVLKP